MNDDASKDPGEPDEDALDVNLRELLRRAPEPARLDAEGRSRMAEALRAASAASTGGEGAPAQGADRHAAGGAPRRHASGRANAPRPARVVRRRAFLAAAAILAIAALGALLLDPLGTDDGGDDRGGLVARDDGADTEALPGGAAPDGGAPERAPVEVADGDGAEQLATADQLDVGDAEDDVLGTLWYPEDVAPTGPTEVEIWSRPVLSLPRVADSERLLLPVAGGLPTEAAPLAFRLAGERARARAVGAERIHVTAIAPGFGRAIATVPVAADTDGDPLALELEPGCTLRGLVTDARTGTPVEGALVLPLTGLPLDSLDVGQRGSDALPRPWAETDASGRFELEGVSVGPLLVRASAPGFAPSTAAATNLEEFFRARDAGDPLPPLEVSIALEPGGSVEGVVEREDGSRFAGALVIASFNDMDTRPGPRGPLTFGGAVADELGRYRIDDLPEGPHVVLVFDADGGRGGAPKAFRFTRVERGETRTVDFLSTASSAGGGSIVGTLRGPGGEPVAGAPLTIGPSSGDEDGWAATTTDDEGRFRFDDLATETYTLLAAEDDFRSLSLLWSGPVDGPETIDVTLSGHRIALVPLAYDDLSQGWQRVEDGWAMFERRTADGEWEFAGSAVLRPGRDGIRGVPAGRYRATWVPTAARALGVAFSEPFDVPDPDRAPVPLRAPAGGSLDVVVVAGDGAPVAGAVVEVLLPEAGRTVPTQDTVLTDAEGRAAVPAVPAGPVRVQVRGPGGETATADLDLDPNDPSPTRLTLDG